MQLSIVNHLIFRVMLTAALGNRVPLESLILRNYHIPITKHGSTVSQKTTSQPLFIPEGLLKKIIIYIYTIKYNIIFKINKINH